MFNFEDYFQEYEKLVAGVDSVFSQVQERFPHEVACRQGCSSCCHALFDLSLVEALYLNQKFNSLEEPLRDEILKRADFADRRVHMIKRDLARRAKAGEDQTALLRYAAEKTVRCPLLDDDERCVLYEFRPVTCRLYGIPMSIDGQGRTCGLSGFAPGGAYPTVRVERIQDRLQQISVALAEGLRSRYTALDQMFVPVSMALLTDYTPEYLGVRQATAEAVAGEE